MIISLKTNPIPAKKCALLLCALLIIALAAGCGGGGSAGNNALVEFPSGASQAGDYCGDGTLQAGEECDDGNNDHNDGCDATCHLEIPPPTCGNSTVETGEECDDGNTFTESCAYGETTCTVCSINCAYATGTTSFCGDTITDTENNEQCDDGNKTTGDGCDDKCWIEINHTNRIAVGDDFTCVLGSNGTVDCGDWGYSIDDSGTGIKSITAGQWSMCFITSLNGVKCYGSYHYGQLGNGGSGHDVVGLTTNVIDISKGDYHACAVTSSGDVKCWGINTYGNLGDGTTDESNVPVDVDDIYLKGNAVKVSAGNAHTCAITKTGTVKCWGCNIQKQLGINGVAEMDYPVEVPGLSQIIDLSLGLAHTCALSAYGEVKCWGYFFNGDTYGGVNGATPTKVQGLENDVVSISSGYSHSCALTQTGKVKCWGRNDHYELGDGTNVSSNEAVEPLGIDGKVVEVAAWGHTTCVLKEDNNVKCWSAIYSSE